MLKIYALLVCLQLTFGVVRGNGYFGGGDNGNGHGWKSPQNSGADTSISSQPQSDSAGSSDQNYWWQANNPFRKPANHPGVVKGDASPGSYGNKPQPQQTSHSRPNVFTPQQNPYNANPQSQNPFPQQQQPNNPYASADSQFPAKPQFQQNPPFNSAPDSQPNANSFERQPQRFQPQNNIPNVPVEECQLTNKADCHKQKNSPLQNQPSQSYETPNGAQEKQPTSPDTQQPDINNFDSDTKRPSTNYQPPAYPQEEPENPAAKPKPLDAAIQYDPGQDDIDAPSYGPLSNDKPNSPPSNQFPPSADQPQQPPSRPQPQNNNPNKPFSPRPANPPPPPPVQNNYQQQQPNYNSPPPQQQPRPQQQQPYQGPYENPYSPAPQPNNPPPNPNSNNINNPPPFRPNPNPQNNFNQPPPQRPNTFNPTGNNNNKPFVPNQQPQYSPQSGAPNQNFADQVPYPGCPAAMLCVPDDRCNIEGIIEEKDVGLTEAAKVHRVALMACSNATTGEIGVCCRDPNYKDPWPDMNGMMPKKDGEQHHHPEKGKSFGGNPGSNAEHAFPQQQQNPFQPQRQPFPSQQQNNPQQQYQPQPQYQPQQQYQQQPQQQYQPQQQQPYNKPQQYKPQQQQQQPQSNFGGYPSGDDY